MRRINNKQGISLIVLVITIIVMIILAATIILSLNNAGIIGNANKAVDKTDEANVKDMAALAWSEAYLDKNIEDIGEYVKNNLKNNGVDLENYAVYVTDTGVEVVRGWLQNGTKVIKGETELEVGSYINYVSGVQEYNDEKGWQVLGAEDGKLLILSRNYVQTDLTLIGKASYNNVYEILENICIPFGKGSKAIGARCIKVEDVDRITGYNPYLYYPNEIYGYGNKITFYWDGTDNPYYESSNGKKGNLSKVHNKFIWENGESVKSTTATSSSKEKILTITNNVHAYKGTRFLSEESLAYKMLFKTADDADFSRYWISTKIIGLASSVISFGTFGIFQGKLNGLGLFYSDETMINTTANVRAVVMLNSSVRVSGDIITGYIIAN